MSIPRPSGPDIDIGPSMLATTWTFYSIAGVIVAARIYTQALITRQFGTGDILMILALICGFVQIILLTIAHYYGFGRHFFYLSNFEKVQALKIEYISEPFGILCTMFGRISFIVYMYRLFGTKRWRRYFLNFLIIEQLLLNIFACIALFTPCKNVRTLWDPKGVPSKCWKHGVPSGLAYLQGATNSLIDLILTILPASIIWNLQMKPRLKLGLATLLGLSVFASVASILKTIKLKAVSELSDYTFNTVSLMIWAVIENSFVMTAASIPLLRPLFNMPKKATTPNPHQMNSSRGTKASACSSRNKSIRAMSSSKEDVLPMQTTDVAGGKGETQGSEDLESNIIKIKTTFQVTHGE